ncbi:MAG TPA: HTH domain-containing protein [Bacteroidetes bacterium]|nr:HTH domain-containing protein [Bacteroidota bacterium]
MVLPFWGWGLARANAQNLKWCGIILQSKRIITASELAKKFNISTRTASLG